ncbi:sialidase family protein [Caulobacter sp. S45]|uniref:WD40/YVTN/BNR-like repeat-containing protein n=1 Tax=Caulobacter sp. S45 TaxID=1641861 RepID=UPI001C205CDD|nr:sialidase family protein [Caulobacter sp. S45]
MSRSLTWVASLAGVLALTAGEARATVDPALFQQLHWRSIGPFRGGRVLAVAGAPDDPKRFYFGAVNGGVWRTDDVGRTWQPIFDDAPVGSIGAIAVAPSAPNVLYVGTGEADMRSDIAQGVGMFRSADGGKTWSPIGLEDTQQIGKILVDPRDPNILLVAALGHPYGPNAQRGVFRSTDGGRTWTKTLFKDADTGAIDMVFQPGNPDVVYAALWQTRRPPWNVYPPSNGPGTGLYKSADGGRTWKPLTSGLPKAPGRIGLSISDAAPNRVYALIDADDGGLYRSDDAGATWVKVTGDTRIWQRGWYFGGITSNPRNADEVWVCDTIILKSEDGGKHFLPVKGDPTGDDFHTLWIDPVNPDRRILGVDQGTLVTLNAGRTWSSWFNQPTGQFYHVATDNRFPYRVYGAQQDSGAAGVPSRTDAGEDGINMTQFHEITAGGESDNIAPDPDDPDTIYGGRVDKLDLKSGQTHDVDPTLAFPAAYRGTWTLPLVFGKRDHALYFGNQRIFRTKDGGAHWTPISPDLTRPTPEVPATLDAATIADAPLSGPRRGVVYAIGPSPSTPGLIWAGTDDGKVWRTLDDGAKWQDVTPKGLAAWSKIGVVEPSHFDAQVAYIAVDRHRLDDPRPYLYRTRDGGKNWTPITQGLAVGVLNAVNVVREDPVRPGLLYAGTEYGAFVSFDDGEAWRPLQNDLPRTSVRDIEVHGDDLVIATHGRGFYVLDDIAALRDLAVDARPGLRLFAPAVAIRQRVSAFTGTPMPKDEPLAVNPPMGANIDYLLPNAPREPVEITILDAQGREVRRFSSVDVPPSPDLAKLDIAPEWRTVETPPAATPGAHRFVWDLHYAAPAGLTPGKKRGGAGVWAPPGRYTVALTVDGRTLRQPLELHPDPRLKVTPDDFAREFALARRLEAARARATMALDDAKDMHQRLVSTAADRPERRAELTALDARLQVLAAVPVEGPRAGPPVPPQTAEALADIAVRLDALAQAVDGADGAPTPDAESGYAQASRALDATLAKWTVLRVEADGMLGPSQTPARARISRSVSSLKRRIALAP